MSIRLCTWRTLWQDLKNKALIYKVTKSLDIYHAYIDNNGKIDIKDHIKKMSELPKKWSDIDNDLTRFNAIMKEKLDYQLPFFKLFNTYPSIKENYEKK